MWARREDSTTDTEAAAVAEAARVGAGGWFGESETQRMIPIEEYHEQK